jgi:glucose/arabinose dehydrogenase
MHFGLILAVLLASFPLYVHAATNGASNCAGEPVAAAKTAEHFCVGVVATGFKAPRAVLPMPDGDLIVADMGSWDSDKGSIWRLHRQGNGYDRTLLAGKLDRPNALALGPDGMVYFTLARRVLRFDPHQAKPLMVDVIGGVSRTAELPSHGRHVLSGLVFDQQGNLFVSVGSSSDHCEADNGAAPKAGRCAEGEGAQALGTIRKYVMQWPEGTVKSHQIWAFGTRNAMAMAVDPASGTLWQGENGRDSMQLAIPALPNDNELPHDELNKIEQGGHYGWPYCYDMNLSSPEYPGERCVGFKAPLRLLPAHAAPLGMVFYRGAGFSARYVHSLIVTYHGYRQHGHRIVALLPDGAGNPLGRSVDLVVGARATGVGETPGVTAPVGIAQGPDGDLYFADDHAHAIFKLHYDASVHQAYAASVARDVFPAFD